MLSLAGIKNSLDEVRAQYYPKNETEKKVYDALSSANWGASTTQLNEIATDSNDYAKYEIIVDVLWRSLDTDGRTWKQLFKSLTLIEFLIKNGAERFIESARDKLHAIRRLEDYNFYEGSVDKGTGIREKAKQVVEILNSNEIIRSEREKARALRNKFGGVSSNSYGGAGPSSGFDGSGFGSSTGRDYSTSDRRASSYSERSGSSYSDSYSNGGIDSGNGSNGKYGDKSGNKPTNTGRYGGGAYDSDRPPRYGDDEMTARSDRSVIKQPDEERASRSGAYKSDADPAATTRGAKLKVNIKKEKSVHSPVAPVVAASALNLIEDDFLSSPSTADTSGNAHAFKNPAATNSFDNFSSSTTQQASAFDPFAPTAPSTIDSFGFGAQPAVAATPVAAFDPFFPTAQQSVPHQQQVQLPQQFQQHPQQQPQQFQQQFQQFQQQPQQFQQQPQQFQQQPQQFQQQPQFFPQQQMPQPVAPTTNYTASAQTSFVSTQPPQAPTASTEADFGDFEAAPAASKLKMDASSKWGNLGNLVDLGAIGKVEPKKDSAVKSAPATFSGLDGFSKNPQSMSSVNRPVVGLAAPVAVNASMNRGHAMGSVPIGNMGGMQMGASYPGMMMGPPLGAVPMGGMPMNYSGMGMGGYPGMMGAPVGGMQMGGMPMGGINQPGMNMSGQQYPGMYPPQQQQQQQYRPNAHGGW